MLRDIVSTLRPACLMLLALSLITGLAYPALVTGLAQAVFPRQAGGSLIVENGTIAGSALIGQQSGGPGKFWARPSATGPQPCNAAASGGSNLGPTNPAQLRNVAERAAALRAGHGPMSESAPVPVELVTASASGLDPHISPAAALYQAPRVARERGLDVEAVRQLIARRTEGRQFGLLGQERVNVLLLNRELDSLAAKAQNAAKP
jgi:K+-transporting ATPase ATPase C chain